MVLSIHTTVRISPVTRVDGARARRRGAAGDVDETIIDETHHIDGAPAETALVPHGDAETRRREQAPKPSIPGTLAAQLIAQRLPGKSERRLARYFPERAHQAYLRAARTAPTTSTRRTA